MSAQQSWMISLGLTSVTESVRNAIPGYVKNDTPSTGQEGIVKERFSDEVRKLLLGNIELALKQNIMNYHDIWYFLLAKEEETGTKIIIRNRSGSLMAETTFRDYVLIQKRETLVKKPSIREQIIGLYKQNIPENEIQTTLKCSRNHVHRCLVDARLKMKGKPRSRIFKIKESF